MRNLYIEIVNHEECGYTVSVNGEVVLECLAEDELQPIKIGELKELYERNKD